VESELKNRKKTTARNGTNFQLRSQMFYFITVITRDVRTHDWFDKYTCITIHTLSDVGQRYNRQIRNERPYTIAPVYIDAQTHAHITRRFKIQEKEQLTKLNQFCKSTQQYQ
jgi:hypothetical protein